VPHTKPVDTLLAHVCQLQYDNSSYQESSTATVKIAVTLDHNLVAQLDQLVAEKQFPNRSRAVQEAIRDKLRRLRRSRLARESAKLDPRYEQALADGGLTEDLEQWPIY
jgi:Arc/MetJ-type ribon-helix-helix transcriptional regulator